MKIDIDQVFSQIINMDSVNVRTLKDIKLKFDAKHRYDFSMGYKKAYHYLCECLLIGYDNNNSRQKIIDLFLVHQYLDFGYLSKDNIGDLRKETEDLNEIISIIEENFFIYRVIGAFQECTELYDILSKSDLWREFPHAEKMLVMKDAAKSYRNIGDFFSALRLYYECLSLSGGQDWLQRVELLLKIGKVYRNYLMQVELAKFYFKEAYTILEKNRDQHWDKKEEIKYRIICLDVLGQVYRDEKEYDKAKKYFEMSQKLNGIKGGRAHIHNILMKHQEYDAVIDSELEEDVKALSELISNLKDIPLDEVGAGIRSVQMGQLKYMGSEKSRKEAYEWIYTGRKIAYRYNDMKTVIRSYMKEAEFLKREKRYQEYIKISLEAKGLASASNQLVLENKIINDIISFSDIMPDMVDIDTKINLIKRRKDIYKMLIGYSKYSINIVQKGLSDSFSKDSLIHMYGIVLDDFEKIFSELNNIIELLNVEIERINQINFAYLNTEVEGCIYKDILHRFKNDLPDINTLNKLEHLCDNLQVKPEDKETLENAKRELESFAGIIAHIKSSSNEVLKKSAQEKKWYVLGKLIRMEIGNIIHYKPGYSDVIKCNFPEQEIEIFIQSVFLRNTISEILNNAFRYAETVLSEKEIAGSFKFYIDIEILNNCTVILKCYSEFRNEEMAKAAGISIREGLTTEQTSRKEGSGYGFVSMKFLFEQILKGKIDVFEDINKIGIEIHMSIDGVRLKIKEAG